MTRRCPECDRTWERRATFCGVCGAALGPDVAGARRRTLGTAGIGTPARTRLVGLATALVLAGALVGGWWLAAPGRDDGAVVVDDAATDEVVSLPGDAPSAPPSAGSVPVELLATCEGPSEPSGCVRWVQRAGQLPRPEPVALATVDGDRLVVLDPETGRQRWTAGTTLPALPPLAIAPDSVLVEDGDGVRAFDARDGDVRWRSMGQHLAATAPDALSQDVVVLDDLEGTLTGVDLVDGTVRWTLPGPAPTGVPVFVVPVGSDLAVVGSSGWVALVDVADGRLAWSVGGRRTTAETPVAVSVAHVVTQVQPDDAPTPVLRVRGLGGEVSAEVPLRTEESLRDVVVTARLLVVRTTAGLTAHRLDGGELQWRRDDLPGRLAAARPVTTPPPGFPGIRPGLGTVATRSLAVVVLGNDGTARVLDDRTGEVVRTLGEPVEDGLRFGGGFLTHRRLWRVDAGALEVHDLASGDRVLRIEVGAPPTVVTTNPVVIATSGRLVRIDVDAAAAEEPDDQ